MELRELTEMPSFVSDIPDISPYMLAQFKTEQDKLIAQAMNDLRKEISIARKETRWLSTNLVVAYNFGVRFENAEKKFLGIPWKVVMWIICTASGGVIAEVLHKLLAK